MLELVFCIGSIWFGRKWAKLAGGLVVVWFGLSSSGTVMSPVDSTQLRSTPYPGLRFLVRRPHQLRRQPATGRRSVTDVRSLSVSLAATCATAGARRCPGLRRSHPKACFASFAGNDHHQVCAPFLLRSCCAKPGRLNPKLKFLSSVKAEAAAMSFTGSNPAS